MLPVSTEPKQVPVHDDERDVVVGERDLNRGLQDGVVDIARIVNAFVPLLPRVVIVFGPVEGLPMRLRGPCLPKLFLLCNFSVDIKVHDFIEIRNHSNLHLSTQPRSTNTTKIV